MAVKAWLAQQAHRLKRSQRHLFSAVARRLPFALRLLPARVPLRAVHHRGSMTARSELMIFLPGIGDILEDFEVNGFIQAVFLHPPPADLIKVEMLISVITRVEPS